MLKFFRKNIKFIIWLIVLSFIVWGASSITVSQKLETQYAGSIRGKKISIKEYMTVLRLYELLAQAQTQNQAKQKTEPEKAKTAAEETKPTAVEKNTVKKGTEVITETQATPAKPVDVQADSKKPENDTPAPISFENIRSAAWQSLILSREAARSKLTVSDEDVRERIRFFLFGKEVFNSNFYDLWIKNQFRGNVRDFEEAVREHLLSEKMRAQLLVDVPEKEREGKWIPKFINLIKEAHVEDYTKQNNASS